VSHSTDSGDVYMLLEAEMDGRLCVQECYWETFWLYLRLWRFCKSIQYHFSADEKREGARNLSALGMSLTIES